MNMQIEISDGFVNAKDKVWFVSSSKNSNQEIYYSEIDKIYDIKFMGRVADVWIAFEETTSLTRYAGIDSDILKRSFFKELENAEAKLVARIMTE